ncbi:hypothetical protein [Campylobacter lanienae]|uniref:hypothetical protein n=1 Tax=Campylobacter lanienae TaxID=75658 RepID=UPI000BB40665|nr:hypothetical protein [Campylobacter lanienae]
MEVKKYDKIVLDSTRSIDDIVAGIKAELSKQESENAGESYICYVSHAYSSGDNAGVNYIVVSDEFKNLNGLSSNVIKASAYTKDEINELIARVEAKIPVDEANLATKEEVNEINSTLTDAINTINTKANADAVVNLTDNQTIEGVKTFSVVPIVATQPTDDNQVANKAYVDSRAVSGGSGDATKASWGLNWAAGIVLTNVGIIEAPSDGVVFLFVKRRYESSSGVTLETFFISPKNNTGYGNFDSWIGSLFCNPEPDQIDTIDSTDPMHSFFSAIPVMPNRDGNYYSTPDYYASSLSSVPVRQGDKLSVCSQIIAKDYSQDKYDEYLLQGVFFPFEK